MHRKSRIDAPGALPRARSIIFYLATNKMGICGTEIARELMLSPSTVSKSAARGQTDSLTQKVETEIFGYQ